VRGWLVVFAKAPSAGRVKTRLSPPFSPGQAAAFYACMLEDVLGTSARAAHSLRIEPVLAVHPPEAIEDLAARAPAGFRVVIQRGPSLAHRMAHVAAQAAAAGSRGVLLRGSDSPLLEEHALAEAWRALHEADLVVSPDRDGGYSLVGVRGPAPGLFDHPMSTASVLEDTLANAARLCLHARLLAPGFDIDTASDLRRLSEARRENPSLPCPRTLAFLDQNGLWPAALAVAADRSAGSR
jgi:hypothetical protein